MKLLPPQLRYHDLIFLEIALPDNICANCCFGQLDFFKYSIVCDNLISCDNLIVFDNLIVLYNLIACDRLIVYDNLIVFVKT